MAKTKYNNEEMKNLMLKNYEDSKKRHDDMYLTKKNAIIENSKNAEDSLNAQYNNAVSGLNTQRANEEQTADILNQRVQKYLPEMLRNRGLSGGMSETSMLQANANYQNNLGRIAQNYDKQKGELETNKMNTLSQMLDSRNKALADAEMSHLAGADALEQQYNRDLMNEEQKQQAWEREDAWKQQAWEREDKQIADRNAKEEQLYQDKKENEKNRYGAEVKTNISNTINGYAQEYGIENIPPQAIEYLRSYLYANAKYFSSQEFDGLEDMILRLGESTPDKTVTLG